MKRLLDFLPAFFCVLYLEYLVFIVYSWGDGPKIGILGYIGPLAGLLLAIVLFSRWTGFWRRFTRFKRCLLLALATVGIASVPTGILVALDWDPRAPFQGFLIILTFSLLSSIIWFPLALFISGLYCLPLWAWEGRSNPNHLSGKLVLGFPIYRTYLLWILSVGFILVLGFYWHRQPASPLWVNSVPGGGHLVTLAAGKAPDGTEVILAGGYYSPWQTGDDLRVVSLDASNGHQRWVKQFKGSSPTITNDPDGDVLVAWNYFDPPKINHSILSKLSGNEGRVVWERRVEPGQTLAANLSAPIPDGMGRIWITGIQKGENGYWNRVLALLDDRDGTSHWERVAQQISHISTESDPNPAQVFPLKDGDAFITCLPYDDNGHGITPGRMECISGKDGSTLWKLDYPAWIEKYIVEAIPLVDEAHQQVVIFSRSASQRGKVINIISYDLITGKERWDSVDAPGENPWSLAASLDNLGNLVLWRSFSEDIPSSGFLLLPWNYFASGVVQHRMKSIREVFSAIDGKLLQSRSFADPYQRVQAILSRPGSHQADALIFRDWNEKDQVLPWEAEFLNQSHWQNPLARRPGGPEAGLQFPSHAVLTPSGHLVIAGPFSEKILKWEIALW